MKLSPRVLGFAQVFIGTLAVTPDAVLLRLAEMHGGGTLWITVTFKLFFISIFCLVHPLSQGLQAIKAGIWLAPTHFFLAALGQGAINMGYALAFLTTSVAEGLMLISLHPMWTALAGRLILKDKIPLRTVIAVVMALASVLLIFVSPAIIGDDQDGARSSLHGNLIAVATGIALSECIIVNRHVAMHRPPAAEIAMEAAAGIGSFACGLVTLAIALAANASSSSDDFAALRPPFWPFVALDGLCIAICTVLATVFAPRHLFGAEVGLVLLGEQILSPIWTFIGVGEVPGNWTIAGGGLLILTLACHEVAALVEERREGGLPSSSEAVTQVKSMDVSPGRSTVLVSSAR